MNVVKFSVNGEQYTLTGTEVSADTSLNDYLRYHLQLHDTKAMCHEGGCGACIVSVSAVNPNTKKKQEFAVNSCLVSILSCHEWDIKTTEGIGNRKQGYHPIQTILAEFNGSQCGYCTPGWVMNMYSLVESNSKMTTKQVENSFGGNMCRCTGYRPILDAFKADATDVEYDLQYNIQDLEDLHLNKCTKQCERRSSTTEDEWCLIGPKPDTFIELNTIGGKWFRAYTFQDVFRILARQGTDSYRLVAGNTGKGVYPISSEPSTIIDITSIERLKLATSDENLILGAGMTLTDVMTTFIEWGMKNVDFAYLEHFYNHMDLVAHIPVRNIGTIGGNLAMKHQHHDFPSDIFLLLLTVGATVSIVNNHLIKSEIKVDDFMKADIKGKLITEVKLPPLSQNITIRTYKIMPRAQNAHAIVNAGFLIRLDIYDIFKSATLVFGNINPNFTRAFETENLLIGMKLDNLGLQKALKKLSGEIVPIDTPPEPSPACRKMIALGLFYKAILSITNKIQNRYKSGGSLLSRGVSRATQTYDTEKDLWPLNRPVPKLDGLAQCVGAVSYSCDVFSGPREVHVAFVLSEICRGQLLGFDTRDVMKIPGVIAFFSAKDIPGKNSFTPSEVPWMGSNEEIFASSTIRFYGQPIGVIVANSRKLAQTAAKLVHVRYKKLDVKPVLTIRDALNAPDKDKRLRQDAKIDAIAKGIEIKHTFSGTFSVPSQYHYTMETQSCHVSISDSTLVVRSSTQWLDLINVAIAKALGIENNKILVEVPRIGGGYGGKAARSSQIACACALVAFILNRPASLVMSMTDNMAAIGKRQACEFDYECAVNNNGFIQYLNVTYYSDNGCSFNDSVAADIATYISNAYINAGFSIVGYSVLTDKPSETWCRAPGTTEGIAFIEHIMERISHITGKDHIDIRVKNLHPKHYGLIDMITSLKHNTNFDDRKIAISQFNRENAWKKKGLKLGLMCYPIGYSGNYPVTISVYHADGTVAISHGGIEMGQGINTKVTQVCAYTLKIPLEKVVIRNTNSFVSPNAMASNGSITSESVAYATVKACEELLSRLEPAMDELYEPTWEELVKRAYENNINLQASYMTSPNDELVGYDVYGVCAAEVELDVLTGNHIVRSLDILEDTGISMSPEIDIGQIEGAFVMGLGLWTSEHLVYDKTSGRLLTDRTWTYKPPGVKDIPENFNVRFKPKSSSNPAGVLRSKATGEPALALAVVVTHALHEAILEARKEFRYRDKDWVCVGTPYTVENIITAISPKIENFLLT